MSPWFARLLVLVAAVAGGFAIGLAVSPSLALAEPDGEAADAAAEAGSDVLPLSDTEVALFYRVKFTPADIVAKYLQQVGLDLAGVQLIPYGATTLPGANQIANRRGNITQPHNTLIIKTTPDRLPLLRKVLALIDIPKRQALLEVRVIEIRHTSGFQFGFDIDFDHDGVVGTFFQAFDLNFNPGAYLEALPTTQPPPFQGFTINFATSALDAATFGVSNIAIRAMQQQGLAEILSNPRLLVEEGSAGQVFSGETILIQEIDQPTPGQFNVKLIEKSVGITLDVLPIMIGEDTLRLRLEPKIQEITGFTSPGAVGVANPIISSRSISTLTTVRDGQTLTLGGLLQTRSAIFTTGIPILSDIPFIGEIFKSHQRDEQRTEIIFMLTPHIIKRGQWSDRPLLIPGDD